MNLNEVLTMGGFTQMTGPGTFISNQVVQPRTVQADEPEQSGEEYEKAKNQQKEQEKIDTKLYNDKEEQELKNYFDDDENSEEIAKKINTVIFALKKDPEIKMARNYTQFAKTMKKELNLSPEQHL